MNPGAIERFHAAQSRNLEQTYDHAWRQGVASYEPQDPEPAPDKNPAVATAPVGTGAALLTRRQQAYREPAAPDAARRARALEPASAGLAKMTDELHQLTPTQEHMQTAEAAARSGEIDAGDMDAYAEALAAGDWLESNAWRLDAGDSVAWSGEQAGYAEAADADGQLLEWLPESDEHVCEDCGSLGELPPMPLSDWPTRPERRAAAALANAGRRDLRDRLQARTGDDGLQGVPAARGEFSGAVAGSARGGAARARGHGRRVDRAPRGDHSSSRGGLRTGGHLANARKLPFDPSRICRFCSSVRPAFRT